MADDGLCKFFGGLEGVRCARTMILGGIDNPDALKNDYFETVCAEGGKGCAELPHYEGIIKLSAGLSRELSGGTR
jgi:hypothetical protein